MKSYNSFIISLVILLSVSNTLATDKMPLPAIFSQAKTIAIVNDAGESSYADKAYDELKKWGRYRVVSDPNQADLVLVITTREDYVGSVGNSTAVTTAQVYGSYGRATTTSTQSSTPVIQGRTYIMVFDGKTGQKVWSDGKKWGRFTRSATRGIIKELKERVEEGPQAELSNSELQEQSKQSAMLRDEPNASTPASRPVLSGDDYNQQGMKLYSLNKFNQAEAAFREAVKIDPYNALYHYNLGTAINALQRYEEAEREIDLAVRLAPNVEAYTKSLETVRSNRRRN